jgi:2-keto-4-pentenoate hydratase/2-oxohepta-3-ene-1,7-dioic acid hydratase in catechol pathway
MKLARYNEGRIAVVRDDALYDVTELAQRVIAAQPPVARGDALVANLEPIRAAIGATQLEHPACRVADAVLLSPVQNPTKLIAAPVNYELHIQEAEADKAITFNHMVARIDQAGLFLKANSSLVGPGEGIGVRFLDRRTDHEVELALVIGKTCTGTTRDEALEYVAGYAIGLDMSIRGTEDRSMRKSIDSYSVLGPWLVTADEIPNPGALDLRIRNNGELKQESNTRHLLRDIRHLIVWAAEWYTLHPGDVLYTGTPEGVAPVKPGDVLDCEVEKVGPMRVAVRAHERTGVAAVR